MEKPLVAWLKMSSLEQQDWFFLAPHKVVCTCNMCCNAYLLFVLQSTFLVNYFYGDTKVSEEIKLCDSYLDIPNISSGDELLEDMELMEREPFDVRPTEALLELLANGGSQFLAGDVSSDHALPSASVKIYNKKVGFNQPMKP